MTGGQEDGKTENRSLAVGLVGYGLGGSAFHAPLIAATPGLRLAAVVTHDPDRAARVKSRYPDARVVPDVDALWAMRGGLDLVVVSAPNVTHVPYARAALSAGLHVVVDKPFAPTAAEAREIGGLADGVSRLAIPFQNRRWDGDFLTVRRLLRDDALGDIHRFESRFERLRPTVKPGWASPGAAERAEGIVYDIGSHLIDQALTLFGPVAEVYAELHRRHPQVVVEDEAFISLVHEGGVTSHLHMSAAAAQPGARMSVWGSRAAFVKHGLDGQEAALRAGGIPGSTGWGAEPRELWGTLGAGEALQRHQTETGTYHAFYAGVERAIRDGSPPPVTIGDAIAYLDVIEAAHRSARERRVVSLG
ncbi:MAG TPA: Gfo/Idh/MocA family oxidoreductase [Gemmatimonadaceae bacterium]|nr:Gfo/Idh/MocA family oxidoreductase [Gemmatimonadaceae bacterium]